jgi:hypothetical protein
MTYILFSALLIGALCGPKTVMHTFAVAFDMLVQGVGWNTPISVTISARAGLAARNGKPFGANVINTLFFNRQHCEDAIDADIARAEEALEILRGK